MGDFLFNNSDLSFIGAFILLSVIFVASSTNVQAAQTQSWEQKHKQLRQQRNVVFIRLEEVHAILVARVQEEAPALLKRLSLNPPKARATGYGLLPVVQDNAPQVSMVPKQTFYSLEWIEGRLHEELEKVEKLSEVAQSVMEIESLVDRFEKSLKSLRNLENNLSYHEKWQKAVVRFPTYYRNENKLAALAREMNTLIMNNSPPEQIVELRRQLIEKVAPFKPTTGLQILYGEGGEMVLPVTVCTDIEDSDFLQAFQEGVQKSFSRSQAAKAAGFAVDLEWRFVGASTLYPGGAPNRGAKIDMSAHRALFPGCPLVLTSGASSLNAWVGSHIFLGTGSVSRRTLAHEFGHLLGFQDAYVRGYDGEPGDTYGVVIVEWTGLTADLMGDSDHGQVSEAMIATLVTAYGGVPAVE